MAFTNSIYFLLGVWGLAGRLLWALNLWVSLTYIQTVGQRQVCSTCLLGDSGWRAALICSMVFSHWSLGAPWVLGRSIDSFLRTRLRTDTASLLPSVKVAMRLNQHQWGGERERRKCLLSSNFLCHRQISFFSALEEFVSECVDLFVNCSECYLETHLDLIISFQGYFWLV